MKPDETPIDCSPESDRLKIDPIVVVEGLHDRQAVERAVSADVWVLGGDRIHHRTLEELSRASRVRGILILTDPDGPGERIRRRIATVIPTALHAFLPKQDAIQHGRVGVEWARPEVIEDSVRKALSRVTTEFGSSETHRLFTTGDLVSNGLMGTPQASARRSFVGDCLGIGYANAKSFVWKLNTLRVSDAEWIEAISRLNKEHGPYGPD